VELRYLRYFATVAEQQSFTRAAEKLHVAQSAISQQIKTLEEELEVKLFVRTKRSVKLTAAGHAFLPEANDILYRVEKSRVEARRAAQGETGTLSIGCVSWTTSLFLPELIRAYRERYPDVRIYLHELTPSQQLEALEVGSIDVGFTGRLPQTWARGFVQEQVYHDRCMVALPEHHALAGLRKISLEKLANEDWVLLNRNPVPEIVCGYAVLCTNAGFSPRVINEPVWMQTVLMMVAAGIGVSLAPSCIRGLHPPGVTFVPIHPDPPPLELVAARLEGEPPPAVAAFLNMLREQAEAVSARVFHCS
jgi:DNA-binding transcriptional LysR family regulator